MPSQSKKPISASERRRRAAQSARDKAAAARSVPGRGRPKGRGRGAGPITLNLSMPSPPQARVGRGQLARSGRATSQREHWRAVLRELHRGLPFMTPTRMEIISTRVRYSLVIPSASTHNPCVLFHPCRSVAHLLAVSPNFGLGLESIPIRAGTSDTGDSLFNWTGESYQSNAEQDPSAGQSVHTLGGAAEAVGVPSTLISPLTRVTGGLLTMRVTCGPGTTGYFAYSSPALSELAPEGGIIALNTAHATNPRVRRVELFEGSHIYHFTVPMTSPPALEQFAPANTHFMWSEHDPFGATLVTFHDVFYNVNLGVRPVVELYCTVGIQCRLEMADRHLATRHETSSKDQKCKTHAGSSDGSAFLGKSKDGMEAHVRQTTSGSPPSVSRPNIRG